MGVSSVHCEILGVILDRRPRRANETAHGTFSKAVLSTWGKGSPIKTTPQYTDVS